MGPIHAAHLQAGNSPSCPFNSGLGHGIFIDANLHKYKLIIKKKQKQKQKTKTVQNKKKKKQKTQGSRHQSQSHSSVPNVTLDRSHASSVSWFPCGKMKRFLKVYRHRRASDIMYHPLKACRQESRQSLAHSFHYQH